MAILAKGDIAPDFEAIDQQENVVRLSELKGKKVILYFYPKDNTPGCTDEACSLRDNYQDLKSKGYEVLGVSADSAKSHQGFIGKHQLPFRLISDTDHKVLEAYGAWGEKKMYGKSYMGILRKTFVIDASGRIEQVIDKVRTKDHAQQILETM